MIPSQPAESSLRRRALEKIAQLSAKSKKDHSGLARLGRLYERSPKSNGVNGTHAPKQATKAPVTVRELEVLLALCQAAASIHSLEHAAKLVDQIGPYLPEVHELNFKQSPYLRAFHPSPWELVARHVVVALLSIGQNHPALRATALSYIKRTVDIWLKVGSHVASRRDAGREDGSDTDTQGDTVRFSVSLLGLLGALTELPQALRPSERFSIIQVLHSVLSEDFLIELEGRISALRSSTHHYKDARPWKRILAAHASTGRPLGAIILQHSFMQLLASATALLIAPPASSDGPDTLDFILEKDMPLETFPGDTLEGTVDKLAGYVVETISFLEDDADFLQVSSVWQQRLALSLKAYSFKAFLYLSLFEDAADADVLMGWLESVVSNPLQLADEELAHTTFKCMAILAKTSKTFASTLGRALPRLIVQTKMAPETAAIAADSLARVLVLLPQDMQISTLYTMGNILSVGNDPSRSNPSIFFESNSGQRSLSSTQNYYSQQDQGSSISLVTSDIDEMDTVHGAVVQSVVRIATRCNDSKIISLAVSMLVQKIGRVSTAIDVKILQGSALLGLRGSPADLRTLLRVYSYVCVHSLRSGSTATLQATMDARLVLAKGIPKSSPLYEIYLAHLLDIVVSTTGAESHDKKSGRGPLGADEIGQILRPLAVLASTDLSRAKFQDTAQIYNLTRDAWYNMVVHNFTLDSSLSNRYSAELEMLALYSPSLVDAERADSRESGIDLNAVLRRNTNQGYADKQKAALTAALPRLSAEIAALDHAELAFLSAAHLVAGLRAQGGTCTRTIEYFYDSKFKSGTVSDVLQGVALFEVDQYLERTIHRRGNKFTAPYLAHELVVILQACCHRVQRVRSIAVAAADRIIRKVPSVLCQKSSLFAMLELLTLMWRSCLDEESGDVEWQSEYSSRRGGVSIQLSDDFDARRDILLALHQNCKSWVTTVMDAKPLDMKGLLQSYLSEFEDVGSYGHVALGRSFALEMGCLIPKTDLRIGDNDKKLNVDANSASDFLAQYTTRQEYRTIDNIFDADKDVNFLCRYPPVVNHDSIDNEVEDSLEVLRELSGQVERGQPVSIDELKPALRRAAALICRKDVDNRELVRLLVRVPCQIFTDESVKLGVSLWTGVLQENISLESQIFAEILMSSEEAMRAGKSIYTASFADPDPFFLKQEFAPTDKEAILRRQQAILAVINPSKRLAQIIGNQYYASRFATYSTEKLVLRYVQNTLSILQHAPAQPLARELHFRTVSSGLNILLNAVHLTAEQQWLFMDISIGCGLKWFMNAPKWSYGADKLQMKAELQAMSEVINLLKGLAAVGQRKQGPRASLQARRDLLVALLQSEIYRLTVWLNPLASGNSSVLHSHQGLRASEDAVASLLLTAWAESPSLAVQLAIRFHSKRIITDVRGLLLKFPETAMDVADAVPILLGVAGSAPTPEQQRIQQLAGGMPPINSDRWLESLLFWAPVNPITAVTYFLPLFGGHPYVTQYAMRALEWHPVDSTFFYVPQIVQALRHDGLGYVERYIIEAATFSQLFAHQIMWNMKANAFKDDESQIPDSIKPTLDKVTDALVSSFSDVDRDFYEREFRFFGEVTDISGKLKPFIKKSKPEKKQKIEQELRKIQVDVGVYLPSNPDGVVIGIDRQSGKPLQSHAKAPYMATFRIRKERRTDLGDLVPVKRVTKGAHSRQVSMDSSRVEATKAVLYYEVWQSAIFKVGDDCRQDVLALQLISTFRSIFNTVGLDVYVFPYRVTATAPGCGVIDVLPNSISRDMLGREQVNGLYEYFISHFGSEDSLAFQKARANFIKSMAAYSVISYLLQFKDRHNGNIMIDDQGHILHIDFGFLFSIAPGGVRFERAPFKLTGEMVAVMGGSSSSAPYRRFEELCVKAFLASRPHADKLASLVTPMLESGLPCFKPETVQHFRERFVLDKPEREAAEFMRMLVKQSDQALSTKGYDQFQLLTNGIPY